MIKVEKAGRCVVATFGPENHSMLTQAPVTVVLDENEAKALAGKLERAVSGENPPSLRA